MKKFIVLASVFLVMLFIGIFVQSYFGNQLKLSTVESSNPKLTYFIENIKHNFGFKLCVSLIISTIITTATGLIFYRKKIRG